MAPLLPSIFILFMAVATRGELVNNWPPHCTNLTKDTDYVSRFKFDYPVVYIPPGQREAYQPMYCVNPSAVRKTVTTVCDWTAPPQVQFTLGDEYMHVVRQDTTGRYIGNAVIVTYQLCGHDAVPPHLLNTTNGFLVTKAQIYTRRQINPPI